MWQLKFNPQKCESICISYKRPPPACKYHLNNQTILSKSVVRYLGIYINSHLKWSDHVKHISAKAFYVLNYLRHTLFASPSTVKATAYNCLDRPILEYTAPAWYMYILPETVTNWKQLSVELHAGHVVADGILKPVAGPNRLPHVYMIYNGHLCILASHILL